MPNASDKVQAITDTVNRYIELLAKGSADELAELYADDATVEDPVGGEVHIGRQAIHGFYSAVNDVQRECELVSLRVAGSEVAFQFRLTVIAGEHRMMIEPIDVMVFDDRGEGHRHEGLLVGRRRHPGLASGGV